MPRGRPLRLANPPTARGDAQSPGRTPSRTCHGICRAAWFDVFWHVLRGPLVGTRWTQFGNMSAAFGVASGIAWIMTQLNVSDILAGRNTNAVRTALAIGHGSLEMGNYFGVDSIAAPAPKPLWLHLPVSTLMLLIHAILTWLKVFNVLEMSLVALGLILVRQAVVSVVMLPLLRPQSRAIAICACIVTILSHVVAVGSTIAMANASLLLVWPCNCVETPGGAVAVAGLGIPALRMIARVVFVHSFTNSSDQRLAIPPFRLRKILNLTMSIATSCSILVAAILQPHPTDTALIVGLAWLWDVIERGIILGTLASPMAATVATAMQLSSMRGGTTRRHNQLDQHATESSASRGAMAQMRVPSLMMQSREIVSETSPRGKSAAPAQTQRMTTISPRNSFLHEDATAPLAHVVSEAPSRDGISRANSGFEQQPGTIVLPPMNSQGDQGAELWGFDVLPRAEQFRWTDLASSRRPVVVTAAINSEPTRAPPHGAGTDLTAEDKTALAAAESVCSRNDTIGVESSRGGSRLAVTPAGMRTQRVVDIGPSEAVNSYKPSPPHGIHSGEAVGTKAGDATMHPADTPHALSTAAVALPRSSSNMVSSDTTGQDESDRGSRRNLPPVLVASQVSSSSHALVRPTTASRPEVIASVSGETRDADAKFMSTALSGTHEAMDRSPTNHHHKDMDTLVGADRQIGSGDKAPPQPGASAESLDMTSSPWKDRQRVLGPASGVAALGRLPPLVGARVKTPDPPQARPSTTNAVVLTSDVAYSGHSGLLPPLRVQSTGQPSRIAAALRADLSGSDQSAAAIGSLSDGSREERSGSGLGEPRTWSKTTESVTDGQDPSLVDAKTGEPNQTDHPLGKAASPPPRPASASWTGRTAQRFRRSKGERDTNAHPGRIHSSHILGTMLDGSVHTADGTANAIHDPAHRRINPVTGILKSPSKGNARDLPVAVRTSSGHHRHSRLTGLQDQRVTIDSTQEPTGPSPHSSGAKDRPSSAVIPYTETADQQRVVPVARSGSQGGHNMVTSLKAQYRTDAVDTCISMISTSFWGSNVMGVIAAMGATVVLFTARADGVPDSLHLGGFITNLILAVGLHLLLEIPGLPLAFTVMRLTSGIPDRTTFNPPPEAILARPSDIMFVASMPISYLALCVAWRIPIN